MKVGYIRVSTQEQNEARQEEIFKAHGIEQTFKDKASGKNTDRSDFKKMMAFVRAGDTVVVESISRIIPVTYCLSSLISQVRVLSLLA